MQTAEKHKPLEGLKERNKIRYNGCVIYYTKGDYVFNRKTYLTIDAARKAVDETIIEIQKPFSFTIQ